MRVDIKSILFEEIEKTRLQIISNMQTNDQMVTGRTARSLHTETTATEGALWGFDHISTLETGISPMQSMQNPFRATYGALRNWYQARGYEMIDNITGKPDRRIFRATINQREIGSVLFRKTGGNPTGLVYGKEVNPLLERLGNRISDAIINVKILE